MILVNQHKTMKNLDQAVIDALEFHASYELPALEFGKPSRRLVVASGNALATGRIIFGDEDAVFAGEDQYKSVIHRFQVDEVVVISASGEKHAPIIISDILNRNIDLYLLTCDRDSTAARLLSEDHVFATKYIEEPITYNTSTYLGMVLAKTKEDPRRILDFIKNVVEPSLFDMSKFQAFYMIVDHRFDLAREMFIAKFDELFGPLLNGRCYTVEQTLHAKTVIRSEEELFISLGYQNEIFGSENARLNIPLFDEASYAAVIAIGYYIIGRIQSQFPPWFRMSAEAYKELQPELFSRHFNSS